MTELFENGALDLLKDIESGDAHGVSPEDIAPDVHQNEMIPGVQYDAKADPESKANTNGGEATTAPLSESARKRIARLFEGKNDEICNFLKNSDDGSFEAFKNSEAYDKAINKDGSKCDLANYVRAVNYLIAGGKISDDELPPGTPKSTRAAKSSNAYAEDDSSSIYVRGEDFDPDSERSSILSNWVNKYENGSMVITAEETFEDMAAIVKEIITGVADKRHALIAGDPGIGKTYLVREVAEKYIAETGRKLYYSAGAMSASLTSIVPFFFFHKDNEVIILDDNDKILMANCDQNVQNFMKGILDPSALHKPVSVPVTMMKQFQAGLDTLAGMLDESTKEEGLRIRIDTEALRENRFVMYVNDEMACNEYLTEKEARELSNKIVSRKLTEKRDEFEDLFAEDDEQGDIPDEDYISQLTMEPEFVFNSSVIFVSNLKLAEISPAVADRCENCEVVLTLPQFMARLEKILGGLCKGAEYSSRPQYVRDWAKACMFVTLQAVVEAFNRGETLFSQRIEIKRKFTFRMFEEFCGFWARRATEIAQQKGLNLEEKADRDEVVPLIEPFVIKKMIKWMSQVARK